MIHPYPSLNQALAKVYPDFQSVVATRQENILHDMLKKLFPENIVHVRRRKVTDLRLKYPIKIGLILRS